MSPKHKDPIEQATKLLALLKYVYGFAVVIIGASVWVALKFNSYDQTQVRVNSLAISDSLNSLRIWQLRDNIVEHEQAIDSLDARQGRIKERLREVRKKVGL